MTQSHSSALRASLIGSTTTVTDRLWPEMRSRTSSLVTGSLRASAPPEERSARWAGAPFGDVKQIEAWCPGRRFKIEAYGDAPKANDLMILVDDQMNKRLLVTVCSNCSLHSPRSNLSTTVSQADPCAC